MSRSGNPAGEVKGDVLINTQGGSFLVNPSKGGGIASALTRARGRSSPETACIASKGIKGVKGRGRTLTLVSSRK